MIRYLIDTNHMSAALKRVSVVRDRMQQLRLKEGAVFAACGPVLCELLVGVDLRKDANANRRRLDLLLSFVRIWPIELVTANEYAKVYRELQKAGRVLSQTDMILASMARQFDAHLLTSDNDFKALPDVRTENWIFKP